MQGVKPELVNLLNAKIDIIKQNAENEIAEKDRHIEKMSKLLQNYKKVDADYQMLVQCDLEKVCKALS